MSKSRGYAFTLNNYTDEEYSNVLAINCNYLVVGKEVGESGTPHLQGYIHFKNPRHFNSVKKLVPRAHVERANGSAKQNYEYCSKGGDFVEVGERPLDKKEVAKLGAQAKIERNLKLIDSSVSLNSLVAEGTLSPFQVCNLKKARDILAQESGSYTPKDLRGLWIVGPPGCGKTRMVHDVYGHDLYLKPQSKWFDGYTGQKNILLDDLDSNTLGHYLKIWADRYSCNGEVKGSSIVLRHDIFIVTSNYFIKDLFPDKMLCQALERRFEVVDCFEDADILKQFYED